MVSVLILTLNEEVDIEGCLTSVNWSDDIVVFDSMSTDRTCEIATRLGARVVKRAFDNYAAQRNAALKDVTYKNPWVLMVDADERVPADLRDEVLRASDTWATDVSMGIFRRRDYMDGRWIGRASGYPSWFGRFVRPEAVWVDRGVNEEYHTNGRTLRLEAHLDHFPFSKGMAWWLERHNRYSTMEAQQRVEAASAATREFPDNDPRGRRRALKQLGFRLPGRPLLVLGYLLFLRGGILGGRVGVRYALLRAWYEWMIDIKTAELRRAKAGAA